ncbi:hypothetical protein [Streptomyces albiflavescens]|uniref:hypothetical protein n=1 Tax=Streptomyces albiflavescens TaxID=1623582 RepID=UPI001669E26F|nr:hypothetical protein [Streptomyces albiflavescens]
MPPKDRDEVLALLRDAEDLGITRIDTSEATVMDGGESAVRLPRTARAPVLSRTEHRWLPVSGQPQGGRRLIASWRSADGSPI